MTDSKPKIPEPAKAPARPVRVKSVDPSKIKIELDLTHKRPLVSCKFDPLGRFLFVGSEDNTVQRFDLKTKSAIGFDGHDSWPHTLDVSPDGKLLISGACDDSVIWWDAEAARSPKPVRKVKAHDGWVRSVAVKPDGKMLASGGNDKLVKLWDLASGKPLKTLSGHAKHVYKLAFHPSKPWLASADLAGIIRLWDVDSGKELRQYDGSQLYEYNGGQGVDYGGIRDIAFRDDGKWLAASGLINASNPLGAVSNPALMVFEVDCKPGTKGKLLKPKPDPKGVGWGVRFLPGGSIAMGVGGNEGGSIMFFPADGPNETSTFKLPNTARDLDLHPDGQRLSTAHHDGHARISLI